jgi:hypothetical protein
MKMLNDSGYFENSYFSEDELKCQGSGELNLAPGFLGMLTWLRIIMDEPMIVTSACRSPEHNRAIGGHPKSLHLTQNDRSINGTMAVDIAVDRTTDVGERYFDDLTDTARHLGWSVGARILLGRSRADFTY